MNVAYIDTSSLIAIAFGEAGGQALARRLDAMDRLHDVPGCGRVSLGGADIVRHALVQRIVEAYDR